MVVSSCSSEHGCISNDQGYERFHGVFVHICYNWSLHLGVLLANTILWISMIGFAHCKIHSPFVTSCVAIAVVFLHNLDLKYWWSQCSEDSITFSWNMYGQLPVTSYNYWGAYQEYLTSYLSLLKKLTSHLASFWSIFYYFQSSFVTFKGCFFTVSLRHI